MAEDTTSQVLSFDPADSNEEPLNSMNRRNSHNSNTSFVPSIPILNNNNARTQSRSRRSSLLEVGGANSISNFASSLKRSANFGSLSGASMGSKQNMSLSSNGSPILHPVSMSPSNDFAQTQLPQTLQLSAQQQQQQQLQQQHQDVLYPSIDEASLASSFSALTSQRSNPEMTPLLGADNKFNDDFLSKSTVPQTILNSINVLIGLGVLSLPLAFRLSGMVFGLIGLVAAAASTSYSAILLGRILKKHDHLMSYNDIGRFVFGASLSYIIFGMFATDLYGASISMIILFADSFSAIFNDVSDSLFKFAICLILFFLNFLPLNVLSILSFAGILCTSLTVLSIFIAGLIKTDSPGSLLSPMTFNLWPESALDFFFSTGLFLAPWGGHAVFPELYRDMRHPHKYNHCINVTFVFSYAVDTFTAIMGFLMFGLVVDDEVTRNILTTPGYPSWIGKLIIVLMGLLPISKLPLVSRPMITYFDSLLLKEYGEESKNLRLVKQLIVRFFWSLILFGSTLVFTSFGQIMAILGSLICFSICISIPVIFYLSVFSNELPGIKKLQLYGILAVSIILTICGTIAGIVH